MEVRRNDFLWHFLCIGFPTIPGSRKEFNNLHNFRYRLSVGHAVVIGPWASHQHFSRTLD